MLVLPLALVLVLVLVSEKANVSSTHARVHLSRNACFALPIETCPRAAREHDSGTRQFTSTT